MSPDSPDAYVVRGWLKYEDGDWDGALADLTRALELDPKNARAWSRRGVVRVLKGQIIEALADCRQAVKLEPDSALIWSHQGAVKFEAGDYKGAIEDCSKAISLKPSLSDAWVDRGGAKLELGNAAGAIDDYTEALRLEPNSAPTLTNRAIAKHDLGDFEGAITDCRRAIQIRPTFRHASSTLRKARDAQERRANWHLELLPSIVIASYLEPYGYGVEDSLTWKCPSQGGPKLGVNVLGHAEEGGHTWYALDCELEQQRASAAKGPAVSSGVLKWKTQRRLNQIREDLHDPVKAALNSTYTRLFAETPFAHTGGPIGTTTRLRDWFCTLCGCLNAKQGAPDLVARTLQFLEAPDPVLSCTAVTADDDIEVSFTSGDTPEKPSPGQSTLHAGLARSGRSGRIIGFSEAETL
mmetsp:Transcript_75101/g.140076  ORF Transcript_75101/g.140076 Transcript_75101/m.140076 type:complete len:410 (+) Transcript_75101:134-1363(+)